MQLHELIRLSGRLPDLQLCTADTFRAGCELISLGMYSVFTVGVALWLAYWPGAGSLADRGGNAITLALAGTILGMKVLYGARRPD